MLHIKNENPLYLFIWDKDKNVIFKVLQPMAIPHLTKYLLLRSILSYSFTGNSAWECPLIRTYS